jgi:hypothetical protein
VRCLAILAVGAALATTGVTARAAPQPSLRIVDDLPLTLRGAGFRPGELARVTIRMGARRLTRATRTGRAGRFTVKLRGVRLDYCATPLTIVARGSRSGVVRARIPLRECASP